MKFTVTQELAVLLKTIRTQNNISAKDLASHIKKSCSYISKLENGDVKNIQKSDLTQILLFISKSNDFYKDVLPNAVRILASYMVPDRLPEQIWLIQYDIIERQITIPAEMAEDLGSRLGSLHLSSSELADILNRNIDAELSPSFPSNEIVALEHNGRTRLSIRLNTSSDAILNIMQKKNLTTNYMFINALVFIILKLQKYGEADVKMPPEQAAGALRDTAAYMEQYQVQSLTGFSQMLSSNDFIDRQISLVNSFDSIRSELFNDIIECFQEALKYDTLSTTQTLEAFSKNLSWDPAFLMKIIGFPFYKLEGLSYKQKKKLIDDIMALLEKYDNISDYEKRLEIY